MRKTFFTVLGISILTLMILPADHLYAQTSHMGQATEDHVLLSYQPVVREEGCPVFITGLSNRAFWRIFPDGGMSLFEIPDSKFFVITDVDWLVDSFDGTEHGRNDLRISVARGVCS